MREIDFQGVGVKGEPGSYVTRGEMEICCVISWPEKSISLKINLLVHFYLKMTFMIEKGIHRKK